MKRTNTIQLLTAVFLLQPVLHTVADDDPLIGDKPFSIILKQLKDANRGLQVRAAKLLSEAPPELKPTLMPKVMPLLKSDRENDRFVAAQFMGDCGPVAKAAIPDLIPLLQGTQFERNRAAAAKALGQILKDASQSTLVDEVTAALMAAFKDTYEDVRREAVTACGMIGPGAKACIPALVPLLNEPPGAQFNLVSVAAAWTCERMGPLAQEHANLLITLMQRYASEYTPAYVLALGAIGPVNDSVIPNIINKIEMYPGDNAVEFKVGAWKTLGSFGSKATVAVPLMKRYMTAGGSEPGFFIHRTALLRAAAAIGPEAKDLLPEIEALKTYINNADWRISQADKDKMHADMHQAALDAFAAVTGKGLVKIKAGKTE